LAEQDIKSIAKWMLKGSAQAVLVFEQDLFKVIREHVLPSPYRWSYFHLTGQPYRAYLYAYSRWTSYWIVYEIDEAVGIVRILRIWHAARDPGEFEKD
jgi:plasmid stabilization system protein ParE